MERKYARFIFLGFAFGLIFGVFIGEAVGNDLLGVAMGGAGGLFLGWFAAAIAQQANNDQEGS